MSFIRDWLEYNSQNECPEGYHMWGALALMSSVIGPKVVCPRGYFDIYPNLYVLLIGEQGGRKTTAKENAFRVLCEHFPEIPTAASCESHQSITKDMAAEDGSAVFTDISGKVFGDAPNSLVEYTPLSLFINEFRNFLSINPAGMINWLTDIYDKTSSFYNYRTANRSRDHILHPYVVLCACDTPDNLILDLKLNVVTGGFFRRTIIVNSTVEKAIAFPDLNDKCRAALKRCVAFLHQLKKVTGCFVWDPPARTFFENWYVGLRENSPTDPLIRGVWMSKDTQVIKVAMLLALCDSNDLILNEEYLQMAISLLDRTEATLPTIAAGIGRNEQAGLVQQLLYMIDLKGGCVDMPTFHNLAFKSFEPSMIEEIKNHMLKTGQIFSPVYEVKSSTGAITRQQGVMTRKHAIEKGIITSEESPPPTLAG